MRAGEVETMLRIPGLMAPSLLPRGPMIRGKLPRLVIVFAWVEAVGRALASEPGPPGDFRHVYGIAWRGRPEDNLRYARAVGYQHVFYQEGMEADRRADGLEYFLESPELTLATLPVELDRGRLPPPSVAKRMEETFVWRSRRPFPENLATGWPRNETRTELVYDLQQQRVIDALVANAVAKVETIRSRNPRFRFAGFAWDQARLEGDFWSTPVSRRDPSDSLPALTAELWSAPSASNVLGAVMQAARDADLARLEDLKETDPVLGPLIERAIPLFAPPASYPCRLSYWTGSDSGLEHAGITHRYARFQDGQAAYFKAMMAAARRLNPHARWIIEPYRIYPEWCAVAERRADADLLVPDLVSQEGCSSAFVEDARIFAKGRLKPDHVACSSPDRFEEEVNRRLAGLAAAHGAWFNWYGRFGGSRSGTMPDYGCIDRVPARLKLARLIPGWENLSGVSLATRHWDGTCYASPNARITPDVLHAIRPGTDRIYAVFLSPRGAVVLPAGAAIQSVSRTNGFLEAAGDGAEDVAVRGVEILPSARARMGEAYIITLTGLVAPSSWGRR